MKLFNCSCGKEGMPLNQRGIHERSAAHIAHIEEHGMAEYEEYEGEAPVQAAPRELPQVMQEAIALSPYDPFKAAKMVRQYMHEHPYEDWGTPLEFMKEHGMIVLNRPRGVNTEALERQWRTRTLKELAEKHRQANHV